MCMIGAQWGRPSIITDDLVELVRGTHYGESSLRNYKAQKLFSADFPLLVAQNCPGEAVVQNIVLQVVDIRTQSKANGVNMDIFCSGTMMMATSFWIGLQTLPLKL